MVKQKPSKAFEIVLLVLLFFLAIQRALVGTTFIVNPDNLMSLHTTQISLWIILFILSIYFLKRESLFSSLQKTLSKYWFVFLFVIFFGASIFWSVNPSISLVRWSILLFAIFSSLYLGVKYKVEEIIDILYWFSIVILTINILYIILFPELGILAVRPYIGNWRGIFWHKNHLGTIIALPNIVFLIKILRTRNENMWFRIGTVLFYLLSFFVIIKSDSATGIILSFVMHGIVILISIWLNFYPKLKKFHYFLIGGLGVFIGAVILLNLGFFFSLVNRSSSLTGRLPMWEYLWENYIQHKKFFGFGYGVFWNIVSNRQTIQNSLGWSYQVMIADNGFIDILLHGGFIGLSFFVLSYGYFWVKSIFWLIEKKELQAGFPLIICIYSLFSNISFSLFFETESLVGIIVFSLLFSMLANSTRD